MPAVQDPVDKYLAEVDRLVASYGDGGYAAAYLNGQIARWDRAKDRLEMWAASDDERPNPIWEGCTVGTIDRMQRELRTRLDAIRADARVRAEAV